MQLSKRHLVDKTNIKSIKIEHYLLKVRSWHLVLGIIHRFLNLFDTKRNYNWHDNCKLFGNFLRKWCFGGFHSDRLVECSTLVWVLDIDPDCQCIRTFQANPDRRICRKFWWNHPIFALMCSNIHFWNWNWKFVYVLSAARAVRA